MKRPRMETPPDDHPAPSAWTPGGWFWSPADGDWVSAGASAAPPAPPLSLPPAPPDSSEVTTDGPV